MRPSPIELAFHHVSHTQLAAYKTLDDVRSSNVFALGSSPSLDTLNALKAEPNYDVLCARVCAMGSNEYREFLAGLTPEQKMAEGPFLQLLQMYRSSGMTLDDLAKLQCDFIKQSAAEKGQSPGEFIAERIKTSGYGGSSSEKWDRLSDAEKKQWNTRAQAIERDLREHAPDDIQKLFRVAEARGGRFVFEPARCEKLGAFAFTSADWSIHFGMGFVEAAEQHRESVFPNLRHEMFGHNVYGKKTYGTAIIEKALEGLDPAEQDKALAGGNSLHSTYGYPETELYAEMYEFTYDSTDNSTDHPFEVDKDGKVVVARDAKRPADVPDKLARIHDFFAPVVRQALVDGLTLRIEIDDAILPKAKELYRTRVKEIFDIATA